MDNGLKCAVGCLIPDGHEAQNSNVCAYSLLELYPDISNFIGLNEDLLYKLQLCHDSVSINGWQNTLSCIATTFSISDKVLWSWTYDEVSGRYTTI